MNILFDRIRDWVYFMLNYIFAKEHPIAYTHTIEQITEVGKSRYNLDDSRFLKGKKIIGLYVRKQNAAGTRKSINGYPLLNNVSLGQAFLYLEENSFRVINRDPLEHYVHESGINTPGSYAQIIMKGDYDAATSYVEFSDATAIVTGEAIELTFIYIHDKHC